MILLLGVQACGPSIGGNHGSGGDDRAPEGDWLKGNYRKFSFTRDEVEAAPAGATVAAQG